MATRLGSEPSRAKTTHPEGSFVLGAPISLADFLALPEDDVVYDRDAHGRLTLMSPDDARRHRSPLGRLLRALTLWTAKRRQPWTVISDPGVAFEKIYDLKGRLVPPSFLGPKAIQPDIACWKGEPGFVEGPKERSHFSASGLELVVEIASPRTWREDLGEGHADAVSRWRTYLENGVSEYWFLNLGVKKCPVPPGTGIFLAHDPEARRFVPLPVERAKTEDEYREIPILESGRVRSLALPGFVLDVGAFFSRP